MKLTSNSELAIHVADLAAAESFYVGALGFRLVQRSDRHLEIDTGALRLYVNLDTEAQGRFIPSFDVADAAAARTWLQSVGCTAVPLQKGGAYLRDPFGLVFDIIER